MGLDYNNMYEVNVGDTYVIEVLVRPYDRYKVKCLYCMPNQENLCFVGETLNGGVRTTTLQWAFKTLLEMHLRRGWKSEDFWH